MSFRKKETDALTGGAIGAAAGLALIAVVVALLQIPAQAKPSTASVHPDTFTSTARP